MILIAGHIAARLAARLDRLIGEPFANAGFGELQDQAIANPARGTQRHRTVGRHPDGQVVSFGPGELHRFGTTLVLRLVTPHQRLDDMDELFEAGEFRRLLAHDPNRTVTAPDTELESPPRLHRQGTEQARRQRPVSGVRIGDARAKTHLGCVLHEHRDGDKALAPQNVAVVEPAIGEASILRLPNQRPRPFRPDNTFKCDPKIHRSPSLTVGS